MFVTGTVKTATAGAGGGGGASVLPLQPVASATASSGVHSLRAMARGNGRSVMGMGSETTSYRLNGAPGSRRVRGWLRVRRSVRVWVARPDPWLKWAAAWTAGRVGPYQRPAAGARANTADRRRP